MADLASDLAALWRRIARVHGARRADHGLALAFLGLCRARYLAAGERRAAAEEALHRAIAEHGAALAEESALAAEVHGRSLQVAAFAAASADDLAEGPDLLDASRSLFE